MAIEYNGSTKILSFANYKGGVGKTTTTALVSYELAKLGFKVLDIDLDPQATLTTLLAQSAGLSKDGVYRVDKTLMQLIEHNEPISEGLVNLFNFKVNDEKVGRLDMIPTTADFSNYGYYLYGHRFNLKQRFSFLKDMIEPIKDQYDFIMLDVSPALDTANWSAYYACDYIVIPMKSDEFTYNGTKTFLDAIGNTLVFNESEDINSDVDILGIIPTIVSPTDLDKRVLKNAREKYGDSVFVNTIPKMQRIQRFGVTGITDKATDVWDKRVHRKTLDVVAELITRLQVEDNTI